MKIVFVGESSGRNIAIPGGVIRATHGEPVTVPDDLANRLLEQNIWEPAKAATKTGGK